MSPRITRETTYLFTHPEQGEGPDRERSIVGLMAFWDAVHREDIGIVERVQAGLDTTPFPGGRLCYRFEEPVHRFQNMIVDHMVGAPRVPEGDGRRRCRCSRPRDGGAEHRRRPGPARVARGAAAPTEEHPPEDPTRTDAVPARPVLLRCGHGD